MSHLEKMKYNEVISTIFLEHDFPRNITEDQIQPGMFKLFALADTIDGLKARQQLITIEEVMNIPSHPNIPRMTARASDIHSPRYIALKDVGEPFSNVKDSLDLFDLEVCMEQLTWAVLYLHDNDIAHGNICNDNLRLKRHKYGSKSIICLQLIGLENATIQPTDKEIKADISAIDALYIELCKNKRDDLQHSIDVKINISAMEDVLPSILSFLQMKDINNCMLVNRMFFRAITNNWTMMQRIKMDIIFYFKDNEISILFSRNRHSESNYMDLIIGIGQHWIGMSPGHIPPNFVIRTLNKGLPFFDYVRFTKVRNPIFSQMDTLDILLKSLFSRAHLHWLSFHGDRSDGTNLVFAIRCAMKYYKGPTNDISLDFRPPPNVNTTELQCEFVKHFKLKKYNVYGGGPDVPSLISLPSMRIDVTLLTFTWTAQVIISFLQDWRSSSRIVGCVESYGGTTSLNMNIWNEVCNSIGVESSRDLFGRYVYFNLVRSSDSSKLHVQYNESKDIIQFLGF